MTSSASEPSISIKVISLPFLSVPIGSYRNTSLRVFFRSKVHQNIVFNTTGSKSCQLCPFVWTIALNSFNQVDCAGYCTTYERIIYNRELSEKSLSKCSRSICSLRYISLKRFNNLCIYFLSSEYFLKRNLLINPP